LEEVLITETKQNKLIHLITKLGRLTAQKKNCLHIDVIKTEIKNVVRSLEKNMKLLSEDSQKELKKLIEKAKK
jgi:hypothetical protein